jgi:hypothetical protein
VNTSRIYAAIAVACFILVVFFVYQFSFLSPDSWIRPEVLFTSLAAATGYGIVLWVYRSAWKQWKFWVISLLSSGACTLTVVLLVSRFTDFARLLAIVTPLIIWIVTHYVLSRSLTDLRM